MMAIYRVPAAEIAVCGLLACSAMCCSRVVTSGGIEAADSAFSVRSYGRNSSSEAVAFPPVADGVSVDDAAREEGPTKFAEPSVMLETFRSEDAVGVTMTPELVSVLLEMDETLSMDDEGLVSEMQDSMVLYKQFYHSYEYFYLKYHISILNY